MVWIYWNNHHHLFQTVKKVNGKVLLANGFLLFCLHGNDSVLGKAIESDSDIKGKISSLAYVVAIPLAYVHPLISCGIFGLVAIMWLIPDKRIEKALKE